MFFRKRKKSRNLVLIVCTANITRSPYFAELLRQMVKNNAVGTNYNVQIDSAGVDAVPGIPALAVINVIASTKGMSLFEHRSKPFTRELGEAARIVLTMEERHKNKILEKFPEFDGKVYTVLEYGRRPSEKRTIDVDDPTGKDVEDFQKFVEIADREAERVFYALLNRGVIE